VRGPLADDIQAELDAELAAADVESLLSGSAGMVEGRAELSEGQRLPATVLKIHDDSVFVALGGPDEGAVPFLQFEEEPKIGQSIEVIVRGFNREDGLYACMLPGQTIDVADLSDIDEGAVVEATITKTNSGGLECSVGGADGFIPISQISEYRVEDTEEFVGQKMVCLVTQCNPRQRKLVLSRRAILEREREERRKEQLESLNVGDTVEGTVRSIKDFGAFVDLGGCDGMLHISQLSWDRIKHPGEVLEEGQRVKVKIDKLDKQSGKISLSYRDLLENPWDTVEQDFPVGQVVRGTVSRIANFGAFVRLGPGIEGLIHISELAHHRVSRVENVVMEGEEVEVKVQSIDRDSRDRIAATIRDWQSGDNASLVLNRRHAGLLPGMTHMALMQDLRIVSSGRFTDLEPLMGSVLPALPPLPERLPGPSHGHVSLRLPGGTPLVELRGVSARYGRRRVLENLDWTVHPGQHVLMEGPNGCGKSTLLALLTGDNHKAYGQDVFLFGRRRGSGESVWDVKSRFGIVSNELHNRYVRGWRVLDVVVSGFFDSVGLYDDAGAPEIAAARDWLSATGLRGVEQAAYHELSFGEQRLALLARAMVKQPPLLVLDEPCVGLDDRYRQRMLELMDRVASAGQTQLLYVSHTTGEAPACINQWFRFLDRGDGTYRIRISPRPESA
jgi:small subunit ribosomal protein S1